MTVTGIRWVSRRRAMPIAVPKSFFESTSVGSIATSSDENGSGDNEVAFRRVIGSATTRLEALTPRQNQVLYFVLERDSCSEAARELGLSTATVRNHMKDIYQRLGVHSRLEAARVSGYVGAP